jgi:hypothetical protein|tara:strand:+ start:421 stop:630 length:210 start_codon:yes stop_codon:yes gene_type:complete
MGKGAIYIGIVFILAGLYWSYEVITTPETPNWLLIHLSVLILVGIGLIIFFRAEGKIEQRKDLNKNKAK